MKAYYNESTGHVICISQADLALPYVQIPHLDQLVDHLNSGMTARIINGQLCFEPDRHTLYAKVREERARLLHEADAKMNCAYDCSMVDGVEVDHALVNSIAHYRQQLRDIVQTDDPGNIVWPQKPWLEQ